jgi:hypothetical protein
MAICEHCGNDYDKSFQVVMNGKTHNFDISSVPSMRLHRRVPIAMSRSWATD